MFVYLCMYDCIMYVLRMHVRKQVTYVNMQAYVYTCLCICVCMYVCMYACMHLLKSGCLQREEIRDRNVLFQYLKEKCM